MELQQMHYNQSRSERNDMEELFANETMKRLKEVTGGKFDAAFGDDHEQKSAEHNMRYIAGPVQTLLYQYNMIVDMAQNEIDETHAFVKARELDITSFKMESNKFLSQQRGKLAWDQYEVCLGQERVVNERLRTKILDRNGDNVKQLIKEGHKVAYDEYNAESQFDMDGGRPSLF